jgi:hypothetical protein
LGPGARRGERRLWVHQRVQRGAADRVQGGWDQSRAALEHVLIPIGGSLYDIPPVVYVELVNDAFFAPYGPDDPDNYCDFYATFNGHPSAGVNGSSFDFAAGTGSNGDLPDIGTGFEGTLDLPPTFDNPRCYALETALFPGGTPTTIMDGMHFGFSFGPLSPYLDNFLFSGTGAGFDPDGVLTSYVAINHPNGAGGVTFPAYDWDYSLYVRTDYGYCVAGLCGLTEVDPSGHFVLGDVHDQPLHGYVKSIPYWYEDLVNLDLALLK